MSQTTWTGPLASGDKNPGVTGGPNIGLVVLSQTVLITFDATLVQSATVNLPASSQLLEVIIDPVTQYNSATSASLTVGTAAGGTQYSSGINVKTASSRTYTAPTAAQATAMANIGTNTAVVATVTSVGQPTAGQTRVTFTYVQTTAQD